MADCRQSYRNGSETIYKDCHCLTGAANIVLQNMSDPWVPKGGSQYFTVGDAVSGVCDQNCDSFTQYVAVETIAKMIGATGRVGGTLVYLRCVQEQDKALALGVLTVLMSLLAFIPGPIIMGAVMDHACKIWESSEGGNC